MRFAARILVPLAGLAMLAGCSSPDTPAPVNSPTRQAPSAPARPKPPAQLTQACPLLGQSELAGAFGGGQFSPEERPKTQRGGGTQFICVYRSSTVDVVLTVSDAPREAETPARFVSTIARTDPGARQVPGVGKSATFIHLVGGDVRVLLGAAKVSGDRFRAVTLALSTGDDGSRRPLTALAKAALGKL